LCIRAICDQRKSAQYVTQKTCAKRPVGVQGVADVKNFLKNASARACVSTVAVTFAATEERFALGVS
jgi:hypothetical protein